MNSEEIDFTDARMLRKKAEKKLKEKQKKVNQITETDVKKLMHELQVHQIELEMQNEELQEAYNTAETALKRFTLLYDFAPMGYFTLDSEGSICELNFTGAEMLGEKRFSLLDSNFKLFISEDSLPVFEIFSVKLYTSNAKRIVRSDRWDMTKKLCVMFIWKALLSATTGNAFYQFLIFRASKSRIILNYLNTPTIQNV